MLTSGPRTIRRAALAGVGAIAGVGVSLGVIPIAHADSGAALPSLTTKTYTGSSISTRFGPVQVQIKVKGTKITSVTAIAYPMTDRTSLTINAQAIPLLQKRSMTAQSARIDGVSGASYTSTAFIRSLQSALTKAGR